MTERRRPEIFCAAQSASRMRKEGAQPLAQSVKGDMVAIGELVEQPKRAMHLDLFLHCEFPQSSVASGQCALTGLGDGEGESAGIERLGFWRRTVVARVSSVGVGLRPGVPMPSVARRRAGRFSGIDSPRRSDAARQAGVRPAGADPRAMPPRMLWVRKQSAPRGGSCAGFPGEITYGGIARSGGRFYRLAQSLRCGAEIYSFEVAIVVEARRRLSRKIDISQLLRRTENGLEVLLPGINKHQPCNVFRIGGRVEAREKAAEGMRGQNGGPFDPRGIEHRVQLVRNRICATRHRHTVAPAQVTGVEDLAGSVVSTDLRLLGYSLENGRRSWPRFNRPDLSIVAIA
jgi:hypothetical protein